MFTKKLLVLLLTTSSCMFAGSNISYLRFKMTNACPGCDLSGMDLTSIFKAAHEQADYKPTTIDLRGTNLENTQLGPVIGVPARPNYYDTNSYGKKHTFTTNLSGANLRNADLCGVVAQGVDFTNTDLRGAQLPFASLDGSDITGANLQNAFVSFASFKNVQAIDNPTLDRTRGYNCADFGNTPRNTISHRAVAGACVGTSKALYALAAALNTIYEIK